MIAFLPDEVDVNVKVVIGISPELAGLWDRQLKLKENDDRIAALTERLKTAAAKLKATQQARPDPITTD